MPEAKSSKRQKTRREANLEATRAHVVEAARRLFLAQGYVGTTVTAIAREAGVAVQTLYNSVGSKTALLHRVFEASVAGPEAPRSAPEFLGERTRRVADARGLTRLLADWFAEVHPRMGTLWRVIDEAATHDEDVARLATERAQRRLDHYARAADALAERGAAPAGLDREDVAALIWAVGHPQVYRTLVEDRGWTPERYRRWVDAALAAALVPPEGPPPGLAQGPAPPS